MPGYSGTPLAKKLGIARGCRLLAVYAPAEYKAWLAPLPADVAFVKRLDKTTDIVHVFSKDRAQLGTFLRDCRAKLKPTGTVWVSWPKKSAKIPTDIVEDTIRLVALPLGFVDVKVCAVSDTWSGLKLVVRKELR